MKSGRKKRSGGYDLCPCCFDRGCHPFATTNPFWAVKKNNRLRAGLCVACGKNPCGCRSKK